MSVGIEEDVTKLLIEPKADILLLMDIQFSSQQWKDLLLWRTRQALNSSEQNPLASAKLIIIMSTCILSWRAVSCVNTFKHFFKEGGGAK